VNTTFVRSNCRELFANTFFALKYNRIRSKIVIRNVDRAISALINNYCQVKLRESAKQLDTTMLCNKSSGHTKKTEFIVRL